MNFMRRRSGQILFTMIPLLLALLAAAETETERDQRMGWFRDGRFGMFIHWGLYAVPAGEWEGRTGYGEWFLEETKMPVSQYEKYAAQFNPVKFDAHEWVRMAKDAGMKYIVITSKHHDGFGLWPSEQTDWCIKNTPFKRDPLKELSEACKEAGITFCFYHSIMDWHHPDWGTRRAWNDTATGTSDMDRYVAYMKAQLKELLTGYGPLGILWFDGEWESPWTHARGVDLYNYVRGLQPNIIVNNRVGKGRSGMAGMDRGDNRVGDYGTPEQEIPPTGFGPGVDWESCMTMNNHWGYNKNDQNWKSAKTLVHNLVDCSSKGGNYLLNVGPTAEGAFPPASVERLAEIGRWMKVNSQAIYKTQASPFKKLPWGRCTSRVGAAGATTLYLHVFDWPANATLVVPGLETKPSNVSLLAGGKKLNSKITPAGLEITVPVAAPDLLSSTLALEFSGKPSIAEPVLGQDASSGAAVLPAAEARLQGSQIQYETGANHNNIGFWLDPAEWVSWELQVTRAGKYRVTAEVAATEGSRLKLIAGGQGIEAVVKATGDYSKYTTIDLGEIELKEKGKSVIELRAVAEGWNPVNVKTVRLEKR